MKFSWTNLKISIAGAKLSHLVQKDRIWDHGSMAEQARIIFYLVQRAKSSGNVESLKKQCTVACFGRICSALQVPGSQHLISLNNPIVKEIAITEVQPGKKNKPDMFSALIRGTNDDHQDEFKAHCLFVRQGEWWMLDNIKYHV